MTDVFISYQRGSEVIARRVADHLRAAGREVWFDADLPPNRSYSDIIREKLEAAKAVLVLWSDAAAQSEWVRAEADHARQHHKLVQGSLDGCIPPMPFNQIQCANLKGWRGDDAHPEWVKIATAVAELTGAEPANAAVPPNRLTRLSHVPRLRTGAAILALALLVAAAGAAAWLWYGHLPAAVSGKTVRAAILPFQVESQAASAHYFADSLSDQIQSALNNSQIQVVSRTDAEALNGANAEAKIAQLGVRLLFDGDVQDDGKTIDVTVHLNDTLNHVILWSGNFSGPSAQSDSLQAHIGAVIVGVLTCSGRALQPDDGISDPQALIQYLVACDRFAQQGEGNAQMIDQMLTALRQVTSRAPSFAPAHSALAKFLAYYAAVTPPEQAAAYRTEATAEAQRALALDPKDADAYVALELLQPAINWGAREALLRKGLAADPDWPHANGFLSLLMAEVGRMDEALVYSRKAAAADPLGESWASSNIMTLAGAGQTQEAEADATRLVNSWPNSTGDWLIRMFANFYEDNWDGVLANLSEPVASSAMPPVDRDHLRSLSLAAKSRDPNLVAKIRNDLLESAQRGPAYVTSSIAGLAALGYLDDAFKLAATYQPGLALTGANSEFLFMPVTAPLRRDPRFMQLADRIGLLGYWRTTGKWPDFCRDPTLPYRCH